MNPIPQVPGLVRPFPSPWIHRIQTPVARGGNAVGDVTAWEGNIVQPVGQRATGK